MIMKKMIATVRGTLGSSLRIMVDKILKAGDILDLTTIVHLVPSETSYSLFFKDYVNFCLHNEGNRIFRVESVLQTHDGYEMRVSAQKALTDKKI